MLLLTKFLLCQYQVIEYYYNMIIDFPQLTTVIIGKDSFIETTSLAFSSKTIYQCSNNRSS